MTRRRSHMASSNVATETEWLAHRSELAKKNYLKNREARLAYQREYARKSREADRIQKATRIQEGKQVQRQKAIDRLYNARPLCPAVRPGAATMAVAGLGRLPPEKLARIINDALRGEVKLV